MRIVVAGHPLPAPLADALESGSWPPAVSDEILAAICGEPPSPSRMFYTLEVMEGENTYWQLQTDPVYLGTPSENLDPALSILIGDLGVDRPFGLDLRTSPPCVRFLTIDGRWVVVADSVEDLLDRLGIEHDPG